MEAVLSKEAAAKASAHRSIILRTAGHTRGGVTRLVSPGDAGELIKPFIFLDLFQLDSARHRMGMHPHSGIATVTVVMDGALEYRETTGSHGVLPTGGIEWMRAGGGVWHEGGPAEGGGVAGFQLWLALPPEDENGPAQSQYLAPDKVQQHGPARVVIGQYGDAASPIRTRASINYLHVRLADGETWCYLPPSSHDVAWVAVGHGALVTAGTTVEREVAIFEPGQSALVFTARGDTEFVLGSAPRHPHELVSGYYSVHTSLAALERGENEIKRIAGQLKAANLM
jgi:redox-sensitive bicupin YhaK (pirin superfamily)